MDSVLSALCEKFIQNRDIIKSTFRWESAFFYPIAAATFLDRRQMADREKLKECYDILKEQTGVFSNFRGYAKLSMVAMLATDPNPKRTMQKMLHVYDSLKEYFFSSSYLPVASMMIADMVEPSWYQEIAGRTRKIYELMKKEHPFLTSSEDSVFAAMLALSDMENEEIVYETERCYQILKNQFFSANAVQSLSHVLALCHGLPEEKCSRTMELFYRLKQNGRKYGTGYELATLGVLAMLPEDLDVIVTKLIEVDNFLAGQKGYGIFGMDRKQRLMHAAMILCSAYIDQSGDHTMHSAALGGTISLIVAQQTAMCAAIAAASAASSASSGGN